MIGRLWSWRVHRRNARSSAGIGSRSSAVTWLWPCTVVDSGLSVRGHSQVTAELRGPIPAELRALRRWTRQDHKRPIMTDGKPAWITDPTTWTNYAKAKASTLGDGLAFVLDLSLIHISEP